MSKFHQDPRLARIYFRVRAHQQTEGGSLTVYPSGRTERTYGAAYGEHALCAWASAKSLVHFLERRCTAIRTRRTTK